MSRKKKQPEPHFFYLPSEDATIDDLVDALAAAPWEVRDEFDRKLRGRLTEIGAKGETNDRTPVDIREACQRARHGGRPR